MEVMDLGLVPYREAWALQERLHSEVVAGATEKLLLLEHPPVITFGRRGPTPHLLASEADLARLGVELVQSDRGGDVTFHGPGQLVAYPIIRLADHGLSVGGYVHALEDAVVSALADLSIQAGKDPAAIGVWVPSSRLGGGMPAKIAAIGVRIRQGTSLHGVALNVNTDLSFFNFIVPCGLSGGRVTSIGCEADTIPTMARVKSLLQGRLESILSPVSAC